MARLLKTNGEIVEIEPKNGKKFSLEEAQQYVDGYVEVVQLKHREILICNEEGIIRDMDYNLNATALLKSSYGPGAQRLYGNVIHCLSKEF